MCLSRVLGVAIYNFTSLLYIFVAIRNTNIQYRHTFVNSFS